MENQELENRIKTFLKNKHFEQPFIQECIIDFIKGHMKLYGSIISEDALFKRLEDNLDRISFYGRANAPHGELGEYKGRIADNTDLNEIFLYFDESDLELSETDKKMWDLYTDVDKESVLKTVEAKRAEIRSTLLHELTHAAYTIKDEFGIGEQHIFSETSKDIISGEYRQIGSNNYNVEAIVNYIKSRIEGKTPEQLDTYQAETQAIYMLAEKVDELLIVQSAWFSNEQQFKQVYIDAISTDTESGEKSYQAFQDGMKKLVLIRTQNISISENILKNKETLHEIQQILDGKAFGLKSTEFQNINKINSLKTNHSEQAESFSFYQQIAKFLSNHPFLMTVPFIKKFVDKQLCILPPAKQQADLKSRKQVFIKQLSTNGIKTSVTQSQNPTNGHKTYEQKSNDTEQEL